MVKTFDFPKVDFPKVDFPNGEDLAQPFPKVD